MAAALVFLIAAIQAPPWAALQATTPAGLASDAVRLLDAGQIAQAQEIVDGALGKAPRNGLLLAIQARVRLAQGQRDAALNAAQQAERYGGREAATQHALALFYARSGNRAKAAELETLYARSPQADRSAAGRAALLNFEVGRLDLAIALGEQALMSDDRPEIRQMLARAYEPVGRQADAIRQYAALASQRPFDEDSYSLYGQALLRMARFGQAVEVLEQGRKQFDRSPQVELALGVAYYAQRRFDDAAGRFLRVIDLAPETQQPYIFLSRMLDQLESRMPEILPRFEAWYAKETADPYAPLVLGKAMASAGEAEKAKALFRESISRNNAIWESHFELAQQLDAAREWSEAAREYERALALSPKQASPHYRLARVYDRLGQREKAAFQRQEHSRLLEEEKHRGLLAEGMR